jgi:hypothetical protein
MFLKRAKTGFVEIVPELQEWPCSLPQLRTFFDFASFEKRLSVRLTANPIRPDQTRSFKRPMITCSTTTSKNECRLGTSMYLYKYW